MDPVKQFNAMHLQEPLPTALDLSMGCKQVPAKTSCLEALDLVTKPARSKRSSGIGNKLVGIPEIVSQGDVSHQIPSGPPHLDPNLNLACGSDSYPMLLHDRNCLPLLKGLLPVSQIGPPCPSADSVPTEDGTADAQMGKVLTNPSESPLMARFAASECSKTDTGLPERVKGSSKRGKKPQNGVRSQSWKVKAGCAATYATDTASSKTRTKGSLVPQDNTSSPSLHSISPISLVSEGSVLPEKCLMDCQTAVESLSSGCVSSGVNSPFSVEFISSDDSDIIEVPVTNSACKQYSQFNGHLLAGTLMVKKNRHEMQIVSTPSHESENVDVSSELVFSQRAETLESGEASSLNLLQDSDRDTDMSACKVLPSTSDAEHVDVPKSPRHGGATGPATPEDGPQEAPPPKKRKKRGESGPKRQRQAKLKSPAPGGKATASASKRRKRKPRSSGPSSSMFSAEEPEIKLKYANLKEEKREGRSSNFAPYVHVDLSACTIVNFQEDVGVVRARKGRRSAVSHAPTGVVPATSKLQLGRVSVDSRSQSEQTCCLCGRMAHAAGLGDLHGPYSPSEPVPGKAHHNHSPKSALGAESGASGLSDREEKPPSKRIKKHYTSDERPSVSEEDSDDGRERWLHEDCSIWCAGVFLVKGKLYGLEEAIRLARGAVCSCCHRAGATLGCFFKGCPYKYHFPCAVQSGCALNEDNFTIRCPRHKDKVPRPSIKGLQSR